MNHSTACLQVQLSNIREFSKTGQWHVKLYRHIYESMYATRLKKLRYTWKYNEFPVGLHQLYHLTDLKSSSCAACGKWPWQIECNRHQVAALWRCNRTQIMWPKNSKVYSRISDWTSKVLSLVGRYMPGSCQPIRSKARYPHCSMDNNTY